MTAVVVDNVPTFLTAKWVQGLSHRWLDQSVRDIQQSGSGGPTLEQEHSYVVNLSGFFGAAVRCSLPITQMFLRELQMAVCVHPCVHGHTTLELADSIDKLKWRLTPQEQAKASFSLGLIGISTGFIRKSCNINTRLDHETKKRLRGWQKSLPSQHSAIQGIWMNENKKIEAYAAQKAEWRAQWEEQEKRSKIEERRQGKERRVAEKEARDFWLRGGF